MRKLALTEFVKKQLRNPAKDGTRLRDRSVEDFDKDLDVHWGSTWTYIGHKDGYAPFCRLFIFKNWTDANAGTIPITNLNRHLLRSDYLARAENELPVLARWIECSHPQRAEYLILVGYTAEQLLKEGEIIDAEYGVVAILGQMSTDEEPMPPITAMRNALGTAEGGSGVPLDREAYMRSVEFWRHNAVVRTT